MSKTNTELYDEMKSLPTEKERLMFFCNVLIPAVYDKVEKDLFVERWKFKK